MKDHTENNRKFEDSAVPIAFGGKILYSQSDKNIFLMNNHRCAYACWKIHFNPSLYQRILMLHVDAHPDAIGSDFPTTILPLGETDESALKLFSDRHLKWDNFLYPYLWEFREKVHLLNLCHDSELCNALCKEQFKAGEKAVFEYTADSDRFFSRIRELEYDGMILDIDLDYFTVDSGDFDNETSIWKEQRVHRFMDSLLQSLKKRPDITTIATSPFCLDGAVDDDMLRRADFLYKIVNEHLQEDRW